MAARLFPIKKSSGNEPEDPRVIKLTKDRGSVDR